MSNDELVQLLRKQASEIADAGINGWGNTMLIAADALSARAQPAEAARVAASELKVAKETANEICRHFDLSDDESDSYYNGYIADKVLEAMRALSAPSPDAPAQRTPKCVYCGGAMDKGEIRCKKCHPDNPAPALPEALTAEVVRAAIELVRRHRLIEYDFQHNRNNNDIALAKYYDEHFDKFIAAVDALASLEAEEESGK